MCTEPRLSGRSWYMVTVMPGSRSSTRLEGVGERPGGEVKLHVRSRELGPGADEPQHRRRRHVEEAGSIHRVAQHLTDQAQTMGPRVVAELRAGQSPLHPRCVVIAKILTHSGQGVPHLDALRTEHLGATDSG